MGKKNDITGKRYGRLIVVKRWEKLPSGHSKWLCVCDCGKPKIVEDSNLKHSDKISCGCWQKELYIENSKWKGESHSHLFQVWQSMIKRCKNPKAQNYKYYGGRGITVCDDWSDNKNGYFLFKGWALSNGYIDGLSLERIDVNGNYSPQNCKWIPLKEQAKNRRNCNMITFNGETKNLTEWSRILGIKRYTLFSRLKNGWSIEKAFTTPTKTR